MEKRKAFSEPLSSEPVLSIYEYNAKSATEIHGDVNIDGYRAVLVQQSLADRKFHPVYFSIKKTTDAVRKYISYELEILDVIRALKKFRWYVLGLTFEIVTDYNACKMIMDKKDMSTK